jgi:putative salt-induced outer membrane protein
LFITAPIAVLNTLQRLVLLVLLLPMFALAQDAPEMEEEAEKSPWSGEIALGYLSSSGNTDTSSATGRLKVGYAKGKWENEFEAKAFGSSDDTGTTAEAYQANFKSLRNLNERHYLFGNAEWRKNRFSGFKSQTFETLGYGYRILIGKVVQWNVEGGAGLSQQEQFITRDPEVTEDKDGAVYTAGTDLNWVISETASFEQILSSNITSDNTAWESVSRLKVDVVGDLKLAIGYTIHGNTDVEDGIDKTDRYTAITLDYAW